MNLILISTTIIGIVVLTYLAKSSKRLTKIQIIDETVSYLSTTIEPTGIRPTPMRRCMKKNRNGRLYNWFKPRYRGHDLEFWLALNRIEHPYNWNQSRLSKEGRDYVKTLKNKYNGI